MFIKTITKKTPEKLKELEIMYQNPLYLSVFLDVAKFADFW